MDRTAAISGAANASEKTVRFEAAPKFSAPFVSGLTAAAIPLILSFYWIAFWVAPDSMGLPLRVSTLACALFRVSSGIGLRSATRKRICSGFWC